MSNRIRAGWALLLVFVVVLVAPATAAFAQDTQAAAELRGTIRAGRDPVPDITITAVDGNGDQVGEAVTDADGKWAIPITATGDYVVTLDVAALPEGVALRADATADVAVTVDELRNTPVAFSLESGGTSIVAAKSDFERILNRAVSGLKVGLLVALAAVGLSLIFGVTGLVNFAHSELVTFGAVIAFAIEAATPLPFVVVIVLATIAGGALGFCLERGLFAPLRRRKMNNISLMVVSIGLAFIIRYLYLIYFGSRKESFEAYRIQEGFSIGPVSLPPKDYYIMGAAIVVLVMIGLLLQKTRLGTSMRAVSDNPALARSSGIDVDRTILSVWVLGAGVAAFGGIMLGLTQTVEWQMGERILLLIFAAVTLGGLGTAYGAMVGGLAIGLASEVSVEWLDNDLKFLVALVALIVILLIRPQGILGVRERFG